MKVNLNALYEYDYYYAKQTQTQLVAYYPNEQLSAKNLRNTVAPSGDQTLSIP